MKIELSNGVIVITPPEISGKILAILFPETEPAEELKGNLGESGKLSAKFRRKFEKKEEANPSKDGWTPEEVQSLISMKKNGIGSGEIARKLAKTPAAVYTKIYILKKEGTLQENQKQAGPGVVSDDSGFRSL